MNNIRSFVKYCSQVRAASEVSVVLLKIYYSVCLDPYVVGTVDVVVIVGHGQPRTAHCTRGAVKETTTCCTCTQAQTHTITTLDVCIYSSHHTLYNKYT